MKPVIAALLAVSAIGTSLPAFAATPEERSAAKLEKARSSAIKDACGKLPKGYELDSRGIARRAGNAARNGNTGRLDDYALGAGVEYGISRILIGNSVKKYNKCSVAAGAAFDARQAQIPQTVTATVDTSRADRDTTRAKAVFDRKYAQFLAKGKIGARFAEPLPSGAGIYTCTMRSKGAACAVVKSPTL